MRICEICGARLQCNKQGHEWEINHGRHNTCYEDRCDLIIKGTDGYLKIRLWSEEKTFTFWRSLHRVVVERQIAAKLKIPRYYLPKRLTIHHKDGNKLNNDISNLEILARKQHVFIHRKEQVERYMDKTLKGLLEFEKQMKELDAATINY